MIKAGIIGGSFPMAGELIRLLINHPDVEIMWVNSERYLGRLVSDVHHGLLGETQLRITPLNKALDDINVLFIFRQKGQTVEWLDEHEVPEDLRIVDLNVDMRDPQVAAKYDFVYGLPELNRKSMVRGAKRAGVPHPAAILASLALLPLAKEQQLSGKVAVSLSVPRLSEGVEDAGELACEIARALRELQSSFDGQIEIDWAPSEHDRVMTAEIALDSHLDIGAILRMYEEFYDDHNFTFLTNETPQPKEVAGTNKCLIRIDKHDDSVKVAAAMDAIIKGAAGTAVHDMNLLFGLHERVGLALKASTY